MDRSGGGGSEGAFEARWIREEMRALVDAEGEGERKGKEPKWDSWGAGAWLLTPYAGLLGLIVGRMRYPCCRPRSSVEFKAVKGVLLVAAAARLTVHESSDSSKESSVKQISIVAEDADIEVKAPARGVWLNA